MWPKQKRSTSQYILTYNIESYDAGLILFFLSPHISFLPLKHQSRNLNRIYTSIDVSTRCPNPNLVHSTITQTLTLTLSTNSKLNSKLNSKP